MKTIILIVLGFSIYSLNAQIIQDESYLEDDFWKFTARLGKCVAERDTVLLKSLLANRVYESKDGCGNEGCTQESLINGYFSSNQSDSWNELGNILRFGFTRVVDGASGKNKTAFQGPSYLKTLDQDKQLGELLILGENVNIRYSPSLKAKVIRQSTYEIFRYDNLAKTIESDDIKWVEIQLENGQKGYIASHLTTINFRKELTVGKIEGIWKIVSFSHIPGC